MEQILAISNFGNLEGFFPAAQNQDSGGTERCNSTRQLPQKPDQCSVDL